MIQNATFSMDESQSILKTFLERYDISQVVQKFVKREAIHLREHIKRIIRETIINIEAHLFKAGKIKSLLLYDHQSEFMFEAFYNLGEILPESEKQNFLLNFVSMKSQGCRILRFGRTDYHVSINSQQRQRIYAHFLHYTQIHKIYQKAISYRDEDINIESPPYCDPHKLFSPRDLQFVFKAYCTYKGDIVRMGQYFRQKGVDDPRFEIESLELSMPNLMLIGYYVAHKKMAEAGQTQLIRWQQFRDKYPLPEECDFKARVIWIRIAIREDPEPNQLKWIQRIQRRKIVANPAKRPQPLKKGPNLDHKKWRKSKQSVIQVIKQQMQKQILLGQQDSVSMDSQTISAQSFKLKSKSQRGQNKFLIPIEEQIEEQLGKKSSSRRGMKSQVPKIQSHKIIEEIDENDVVWEQIPDKSNSLQPSQQNISAKFYSEKANYDKPSNQPSIRSQINNEKERKKIEYRDRRNQVYNKQDSDDQQEQNYNQVDLSGQQPSEDQNKSQLSDQ